MLQKPIYLDTSVWNRLLAQNVDPARLLDSLKSRDANIAVSAQAMYELAKAFERNPQKARALFRYLKQYVDAGVIGAHDMMQLLRGEVKAMHARVPGAVVAYFGQPEYAEMKTEIDKLAGGIVDQRAQNAIAERQGFAEATRIDQVTHFVNRPDMKAKLQGGQRDALQTWLEAESLSDQGTLMLAAHLTRIHTDASRNVAQNNAYFLLRLPGSRVAKALVRTDLYLNWRCANYGGVPRDIVDDAYHVLNASYCSVYATADTDQRKYAHLLLDKRTQVAIYEDGAPLDEWLIGLADSAVGTAMPASRTEYAYR
jgi:hypothetical protein